MSESISPGELVNMAGIAAKIGLSRPAVSNYTRRYKDFPKPVEAPGVIGIKLYRWSEVEAWFEENLAEREPRGFGQSDSQEKDIEYP